jgi:glutamate-1-semialdehyde 2,1-aminomutase
MFDNSVKAYTKACEVIPGGVDSPVRAFKSVGGTPPFIERGEGAYMYDVDGNKYLDFVQSWGPLIFGHCDKDIEDAVMKTVKKGLSFGAPTELETQLAEEIVEMFDHIDKVRFVSSGTEAVMSAIRLARGVTGKDDILKFEGCYHGHSDSLLVQAGSGLATFGTPSSPGVPADLTKHTLLCEYNNIENLKKCFEDSDDISCIIIEPVAGNMGLVPASPEFLKACRKLCDENGALLIYDEVMTGFRVSLTGASGILEPQADIITFGKVIGAGMPVGAFASSKKIMDHLSPDGTVYQAGTLSGNPVAMSAGLTSLRKLKANPSIYDELSAKALRLVNGLKEVANKNNIPLQVNTRGSMFGFFFCEEEATNIKEVGKCDFDRFAKFHHEMLKRGFYFACSQYEAGFISSVMTNEDIDACIDAASEVMKSL